MVSPVFCYAGKNNDSLLQVILNKNLPDSVRQDAEHSLINNNVYSDPQLALKYALEIEKSLYSEEKAEWLAELFWKKGILYRELGDMKKSSDALYDALEMAEKNNILLLKSKIYNSLGSLYHSQNNFEKSKEMFLKSFEISKASGKKPYLADSYVNLGAIEQNLKNYDKSVEYSKEALKLFIEMGDQDGAAYVYSNLSTVFEKNNELDSALFYDFKALEIFKSYKNNRGISTTMYSIGAHYLKNNDLKSAIKYCKEAYTIADQANLLNVKKSACNCLSTTLADSDPVAALNYLKEYYEIKDSLMNEDALSENVRREMQFKYRETQISDSLLRAKEDAEKQLEHENEVKQQKLFTYVGTGIAVIAFGFLFVVYRGLRQKKRANVILEEKNLLIQRQKKIVEEQKLIVEEKQKEITDSINYAKRIQYSLLAHDEMLKKNLPEYFVLFKPKDIVSGDFYWCTKKKSGNESENEGDFYLAVCDCTGHGVPGAFMSLLNISFLNEAINEKNISEPHEVLNHVRQRLIENMEGGQDGMDATLIKIKMTNSKWQIKYASAHNRPVLIRNKEIIELPADKMPVGKGERNDSFTLHEIDVFKDDLLFFYTDGYADQFGGSKGKKFKYSNLQRVLVDNSNQLLIDINRKLEDEFEQWKGDLEQVDDVCIIGIRL